MFNILYECVWEKKIIIIIEWILFILEWGYFSEKEKDDWWYGKEIVDVWEVGEGGCFEGEGEG